MPLTTGALNSMATSLAGIATHLALHTADPGTSGANPSSAARVAAGWTAAANGGITTTNKSFTGGTAGGPVTHVGLWSALTDGTFYGSFPITGDTSFSTSGTYTLTNLTVNSTTS